MQSERWGAVLLVVGWLAGSAGRPLRVAFSGQVPACAVRGALLPRAPLLRLRGGATAEGGTGKAGGGKRSAPEEDEGMASGLLRDMKEALLRGEIPAAARPDRAPRLPKSGPGSMHRTEPLCGWTKNAGGSFGIELPEGGLAGGGERPEPLRVEWAKRLANASDTAALWGHKLVQLCDNVSVSLDLCTERGPFCLDVDAALRCLDQGADVNGRGPFDLTPLLMLCAADGHEFVIARLLEAGADVHAQDVIGNTALHEAVRCRAKGDMRSLEVVKLLLDAGARADLGDRWNETALDFAHESLARHTWWSGMSSTQAARARDIVALLGGNVNYGVERLVTQTAKLQRRIQRERDRHRAKLAKQANEIEAKPRHYLEYQSVE